MASNSRREDYEAYARRRRALRRHGGNHGFYGGGRGGLERQKRGFPMWAIALIVIASIGGLIGAGAGVFALGTYNKYADELVAPDELAINQPSYGAKILDRNGKVLYEYVDDKSGLRRPTHIEDITPSFLAAEVSTEDDSFFTNPGINLEGLARAALENSPLGGGGVFEGSGGSSITQQLVKNVYIPEDERTQRKLDRKIKETVYALELTKRYSKSQILEWYVNQIGYGGVFNGVEAASLGYFGKHASELTLAEAATLAGIPQSPAAYDPVTHPDAAVERRNEVLDLMLRQSPIQIGEDKYFTVTPEEVAAAKAEPIDVQDRQFQIEAPHWVLSYIEPQLREMLGCPSRAEMQQEVQAGTRDLLLGRPGEGCEALFTEGLVVTTTLDLDLQKKVEGILNEQIGKYEESSNTHNGAMMVMDPKTGQILVMVGSRDYYNDAIDGRNNNAIACNSPGSSFKPFAYLTTFEQLGWGPGTMILDAPITYTDDLGREFTPSNPLHDFAGPISIRQALGNSLNIPANKAAAAVGAQSVVVEARKVGFVDTFRLDGCSGTGGYGPAIATGGVDVTLADMMYGYSTLAAGGVMHGQEPIVPHDSDERQADPVSILKIVDNLGNVRWDITDKQEEIQVVDPGYTYLLWDILTDSNARCRTFGCGLNVPGYKVAVKTGTSEPYPEDDPECGGKIGETWAFGYSPDLVVGIWAGNSDNSCLVNISSASLAFYAMNDTFIAAMDGRTETDFPRPDDVEEAQICEPSGLLATDLCGLRSTDLFVKGNVPTQKDTWWQKVKIDNRNNKLATSKTPQQYVEERVMLVPPADWRANNGEDWASALGVALAPTQQSELGAGPADGQPGSDNNTNAAQIINPSNGKTVKGSVQILGRAAVDDFKQYKLEFGEGPNPDSWTTIITVPLERELGVLGVWDTSNLESGGYTVRLTVTDKDGKDYVSTVVVSVDN
jgi:membrane peptidoglycan carboxypeptidase